MSRSAVATAAVTHIQQLVQTGALKPVVGAEIRLPRVSETDRHMPQASR